MNPPLYILHCPDGFTVPEGELLARLQSSPLGIWRQDTHLIPATLRPVPPVPTEPGWRETLENLRTLWKRWPNVSANEMQMACKAADKALAPATGGVAADHTITLGGYTLKRKVTAVEARDIASFHTKHWPEEKVVIEKQPAAPVPAAETNFPEFSAPVTPAQQCMELCYQIEKCGASPELTQASIMATDLCWRLADHYAPKGALRVAVDLREDEKPIIPSPPVERCPACGGRGSILHVNCIDEKPCPKGCKPKQPTPATDEEMRKAFEEWVSHPDRGWNLARMDITEGPYRFDRVYDSWNIWKACTRWMEGRAKSK